MTNLNKVVMPDTHPFSPDEPLVAELHRLGVKHLMRFDFERPSESLPADELIAALAAHPQARFRSALILLFLRQPRYSRFLPAALARLTASPAASLRLYYQAAVYLRPEIEDDLRQFSDEVAPLPDLFSAELGLPAPTAVPVHEALTALGELHHRLTGRAYNWAGSYRQHLPLFLRQLKRPIAVRRPAAHRRCRLHYSRTGQ